ncbi:metal-dependent hydrolase [Thermophilibacter provencensis]|uniref:Metal-dependent hydrolase n=1 Tax=Thermophilibacter provencensis TaxID=1852386 RepID=A0ABT7V374_9ACTN|nr:metal-dependent hydrolase [Thermophilibacter provencensis]MDM8271055.1 metal-dependent hydrolase [Thermophilibacter provencensis]
MTGRTHLAVGAAAALLAAGPGAPLTTLALAASCGAAGATLPDLDVRDTAHPWRERLSRAGAAALLVGALVFDAANGSAVLREAASHGLGRLALGIVGLVALACASRLSAHRGFSHSLLALAGYAAATWLVCPPLAPYLALGFATHLALDALTYRGLRLFWPLPHGLSARLCKTGGVVDACLLAAAVLAVALLAWQALS